MTFTPRKEEFIRFLLAEGALRFGRFTLKSGDTSPFFINLGAIASGPALARLGLELAQALAALHPEATHLFGPAYKGIAMATAAALAAHRHDGRTLQLFFDRKEAKAHGEGGGFIGALPGPGDRVVIIDDVVSNGGTKVAAMAALEENFGVRAQGILVTVNRVRQRDRAGLAGLPLQALVDVADLVTWLETTQDPMAGAVRDFYLAP